MIAEFTTKLDALVNTMISSNVASLIAYIMPVMSVCVSLYLAYKAFEYFYSPPDIPIMDILKFYMSLILVMAFGLNADTYLTEIVPIITDTGDEIARLFTSNGATLGQSLDNVVEKFLLVIWDIWSTSSGASGTLFAIFAIAVLLIGGVPIIITAFAYIIIAKVLLGVVAIFGVLFICFLFFPTTRSMFYSWLGAVFSYVLLIGSLGLILGLMFNFIDEFVLKPLTDKGGDQGYLITIIWVAIIMKSFDMVLDNLLGLVQKLGGGAGVSGGKSLASSMMGGKTAGRMVKMTAGQAQKLGGRAATAITNKLKGALGG